MLVKTFKPYLPSLASGQVDCDALVEKYIRYGAVLELQATPLPAGFAALYCNDLQTGRAYLSTLVLLPEYRDRGLGKYLLRTALDYAHQRQMQWMELEVRKDNTNALRFYQKNGFAFTGRETDHSFFMVRSCEPCD